jgi:hypothetical protein
LNFVVAGVTVTNGGSGYSTAPSVSFTGGGGSGAAASSTVGYALAGVTVTNGGTGYITAPVVSFTGGEGTGATATAALAFLSPSPVAGITVTNAGRGYLSAPTVSFTGGGGTGAAATATLAPAGAVRNVTLTNGGNYYTSLPLVSFTGGGGTGAVAVANISGGTTMDLQPKSIIEDFDVHFGRMNAMLGVEIPRTNLNIQTSIPYYDIDPPTEIFRDSDPAVPIGTLSDGTQIWKITHNGVDTHAVHWHMFNVQVINRVGWDGAITPPDANELGWKETVRMNPLEDIIVAMRPIKPNIPWDLPNSIRPLDVTAPVGVAMLPSQFHNIDPINEPAPVINHLINYGWEYVWHCHLLGHEENIMMRSMIFAVAPQAPSGLIATPTGTIPAPTVTMTWTDNSVSETNWTVQRATNPAGPWTNVTTLPSTTGPQTGATVTYEDTTVAGATTYYYRVMAINIVGDTTVYAAPAAGYPSREAPSIPSNTATVTTL